MRLGAKFFMLFSLMCISFFLSITCHEEFLKEWNHSYKIISHRKEINLDKKGYDFFLKCESEIGLYEIDVSEKTYYNNRDGDVIKFDNKFKVYELYKYALNEKTRRNVLSLIQDEKIKFVVKNKINVCILFCFVFGVIFVISFAYNKGKFDD